MPGRGYRAVGADTNIALDLGKLALSMRSCGGCQKEKEGCGSGGVVTRQTFLPTATMAGSMSGRQHGDLSSIFTERCPAMSVLSALRQ
jgi:hypothetical protein